MPSTIFIADDSLYARMMVKQAVNQIFSDSTYIEVSSGAEVLDKLAASDQADWFLLDMNMGEPDGLTTAKSLVEQGVEVGKITLVTGNKSSDLQAMADDMNLSCINKAMSPKDIDGFIERLRGFFGEQ